MWNLVRMFLSCRVPTLVKMVAWVPEHWEHFNLRNAYFFWNLNFVLLCNLSGLVVSLTDGKFFEDKRIPRCLSFLNLGVWYSCPPKLRALWAWRSREGWLTRHLMMSTGTTNRFLFINYYGYTSSARFLIGSFLYPLVHFSFLLVCV